MVEWRVHPKFTAYEVSDEGDVRRVKPAKGAVVGKCLKPHVGADGYARVTLSMGHKLWTTTIHRLVLETFDGPPDDRQEALHKDGVKSNNRKWNLRWGTHRENYADRVAHGGGNHGERHGMAKLNDSDIPKIFAAREAGLLQKQIAHLFGVSRSQIGAILRGTGRGRPCHL